jgi:hypothetical protein
MNDKKNAYRLSVRKPKGMRSLKDPGIESRILVKCILQTQEWMAWARLICLRIGKSGRLF